MERVLRDCRPWRYRLVRDRRRDHTEPAKPTRTASAVHRRFDDRAQARPAVPGWNRRAHVRRPVHRRPGRSSIGCRPGLFR